MQYLTKAVPETLKTFVQRRAMIGNVSCHLNIVNSSQYDEVHSVMKESCGKNQEQPFGDNEFGGVAEFKEYLRASIVVLFQPDSNRIANIRNTNAIGFITPSKYQRTLHPVYTENTILVVDQKSFSSTDNYADYLKALEGISKEIGYHGCIIDTFLSNQLTVNAARKLDYNITAYIPNSGRKGNRLSDAIVMFKAINRDKPLPNVDEFEDEIFPSPPEILQQKKPQLKYIPTSFQFPKGPLVTLKHLEEHHVERCAEILRESAQGQAGISKAELELVEIYLQESLTGRYGTYGIVAETDQGEIVAYDLVFPNAYSKDVNPVLADGLGVVNKKFMSREIGCAMFSLGLRIIRDLGYSALLTDVLLPHYPSQNIVRKLGLVPCGSMPNNSYLPGRGWTDGVFYYKDLTDMNISDTFLGIPPLAKL